MSRYFFTADEHYCHENIIKFCNRPFVSVEEMNQELINRNNEVVRDDDFVIHAGDFCWKSHYDTVKSIQSQLKGNHIFLKGSHDKWMAHNYHEIWEQNIEGQYVVVCHYQMKAWPRSHYGSWQLYGHSHGRSVPLLNQYDVGVDNNNFYPISMETLRLCILRSDYKTWEIQT